MMRILMTMKGSPQEQRTASTWTGWQFMSLDTAWAWNIPTCVNPSCTLGTKDISRILNLPMMISKAYRHFMEVSSFYFSILFFLLGYPFVDSVFWMSETSVSIYAKHGFDVVFKISLLFFFQLSCNKMPRSGML